MSYTNDVLSNCTSETYVILLTNATLIKSTDKNKEYKLESWFSFFTAPKTIVSPYGYLCLLTPSELNSPIHSVLEVLVSIQFKIFWVEVWVRVLHYIRQNEIYKGGYDNKYEAQID